MEQDAACFVSNQNKRHDDMDDVGEERRVSATSHDREENVSFKDVSCHDCLYMCASRKDGTL